MHALVPLSLLESMREIDLRSVDEPIEYEREGGGRRLGINQTVADQIVRYRDLSNRRISVPDEEVLSIMRLCGRRPDAELVFSDAGRRAAGLAVDNLLTGVRLTLRFLPGRLRHHLGRVVARRLALRVFDIALEHENGNAAGRPSRESLGALATPDGAACQFFGSAVAALLRNLTDFDGAVTHVECVAQNGARCAWHTRHTS